MQLFVDRSQLTRTDFQVTPGNAAAVAALCDYLEGLPLAIELAAAWAQSLTPNQMLSRLSRRFDLLSSRKRDIGSRHQTLRTALDWSYRLLAPELQQFFARLSVFRGGWALLAAEAVCEEPEALEALAQLQARSLVITEETGAEMRYRLLETLREYASEQLGEEERNRLARRHAEHFLGVAEEIAPQTVGEAQAAWLGRLEAEHDNLRTALNWSLEHAPTLGIQLAAALWRFWFVRGYWSEGRRWLTRALSHGGGQRPEGVRAKALIGAGILAWSQGDYLPARSLYEESLAICRESGNTQGIASALNNLATVARDQGDHAAARAAYEESLVTYRHLSDASGIASVSINLGGIAIDQGDYATARSLLEEGLALQRQLGDRWSIASALHNLAEVACKQGDYAMARPLFQESLTMWRALGDRKYIPLSLASLGIVAKDQGDCERAARLFGAAEAAREGVGAALPPAERREHEHNVAAIRAGLSAKVFLAAWRQGRAMALEQAVAYALERADSLTGADPLTDVMVDGNVLVLHSA